MNSFKGDKGDKGDRHRPWTFVRLGWTIKKQAPLQLWMVPVFLHFPAFNGASLVVFVF
jgi:hypothetical protein